MSRLLLKLKARTKAKLLPNLRRRNVLLFYLVRNYSLLIANERVAQPYPGLQNRNYPLNEEGINPTTHPIRLTRHHIIPLSSLITFWNKVINNGHATELKVFFNAMSHQYPEYRKNFAHNDEKEIEEIQELMSNIVNATIIHGVGPPGNPNRLDEVVEIYQWLPGNLFIGPTERADDAKDGFESQSTWIVGSPLYENLLHASNEIKEYNALQNAANSKDNVKSISKRLAFVANFAEAPKKLNPANWVYKKGGTNYTILQQKPKGDSAIMQKNK